MTQERFWTFSIWRVKDSAEMPEVFTGDINESFEQWGEIKVLREEYESRDQAADWIGARLNLDEDEFLMPEDHG